MVEGSRFPPHLPEELQNPRDLWIGQSNPFNPQLTVNGPTIEEIRRAYKDKTVIVLSLTSHTADMDLGESDDEGNAEVSVSRMYEDGDVIHFLAHGSGIPYSGGTIWVWEYDREGPADVFARQDIFSYLIEKGSEITPENLGLKKMFQCIDTSLQTN